MAAYRKLFMSGGVGYSPTFSMRRTARTLIFLHVPKTGGTTFRKILERSYSGEAVLTLKGADYTADFENFANSAESERRRYRLIQGHLYFGFHDLVPGDSSYVVWLRDPIARALSFYAHVRTHSDHYLHQRVIDKRLDLRKLIEGNATPELFNLQTRMIAGQRNNPNRPLDRTALEIAKKNLETNFCFVGLTENFDASLILLGELLGRKVPFYTRRNVTRQRTPAVHLDPEMDRLLRKANDLDLELYEFAKVLFETRRRAAGPEFDSQVARFQRLNSIAASAQRSVARIKSTVANAVTFGRRRQQLATLEEGAAGPSV